VRRVHAVDLMLFGTILLWALNSTVTRYVLTHGFHPLAYATTRYGAATLLFWIYTYLREGSFRIARRDLRYVAIAGLAIYVNQLCFVYAVDKTTAATVTLFLATTPIFIGVVASAVGLERLGRTFWIATSISIVGVAFVASGSGGFSGNLLGDGLAILTAATWGCYSVAITPLMRRYSAFRISSVVLPLGWVPLALVSIPQLSSQTTAGFGWTMAFAFAFAVVGPLFLTNILWFTAIGKVGPSRATLFANLEPFFAVLFAVLLLSESLNGLEIAGGALIAAGIVIERRGHHAPEPVVVLGE
jgi:drug/metabolite transporter (DMT)-like permease